MAAEIMLTGELLQESATQQKLPADKSATTRVDKFVFGIPQNGLTEIEREVPLDEPPPLPQNSELLYIGKPTPRYDGAAKAMGRGKYTADVPTAGDALRAHGGCDDSAWTHYVDRYQRRREVAGREGCACDRAHIWAR